MIEHWDGTRDGELTETSMRRKLEARGFVVHCYVYAPGTYFPEHSHSVDKIDGVLAGRFRLSMKGTTVILQAGDCIAVPAGEIHSAEVIGNESVISLDAVRKK
ncbi:MAG: cupin domain-containing protein [Gammaproteobacteria bacterium]|nr:MAG: cupin domain-containing protein [Gammaproteobacteria bacterium]